MDLNLIVERFKLISGLDSSEISKWLPLCKDGLDHIENRIKRSTDIYKNSNRLSNAAAAYAYYKYTFYDNSNSYNRFSAGDIRIELNEDYHKKAKGIWLEEEENISDLIKDNNKDFVFQRIR